jgi:hypothetical protein
MVAALPALALGTAGTAATATAAATAATTGLFGAAGAFSFMQTASTLGTLFSIGSTLAGGSADKAAAESQARWDDFRARQDTLRGEQEATKIKEDLARSVSSAVAIGGAQGIDISSGSPANAIQKANQDASNSWSVVRYNAANDAAANRANAYATRQRGANAYRSSRAAAGGMFSDFAMRQSDRGMSF